MATAPANVSFLNSLSNNRLLREGKSSRDLRTHRLPRVRCQQQSTGGDGNDAEKSRLLLDRRDMLLAMGGLYGAAAGNSAMANPVMPPSLSACKPRAVENNIETAMPGTDLLKCCPPYTGKEMNIVDYPFPRTALRVRRPAHLVADDEEYMSKYKEAISKMKALPEDDPRNFYQQAKIHCAYCNDAYNQVNSNNPLQVHFSWLFLPWHRYYLHFFERILGKLIDDDTFALPYWNFDHPDGMMFPSIFIDKNSPLYNPTRNEDHFPPAIVDYKYGYTNVAGSGASGQDLIKANLDYMRKAMIESKALPELFMGDPARGGDLVAPYAGMGQIEVIHNAFHQWVGPVASPHIDMGSFATAGRDCSFYVLHANVDRLWQVYRNLRGGKVEFNDADWLDATYIFYDEDGQVVKVKTHDSLNPTKLCFTYEEQPLPWLGKVPKKKASAVTKTKQQLSLVPVNEFGSSPRALNEVIRASVPRPKTNRSKDEKEDKVEVLVVKDIDVGPKAARFDVYISVPVGDLAAPDYGEFVGSFVKLPHEKKAGGKKTQLKLGITGVLEDIAADNAEKLIVTLVPAHGDITVGGLQIKLIQTDTATIV